MNNFYAATETLTTTVQPITEPITVAELKDAIGISHSNQDAELGRKITAARQFAENRTRRHFVQRTIQLLLDRFPPGREAITFPVAPISSITSIYYIDQAGDSTEWSSDDWATDLASEPAFLYPIYGETYPTTQAIYRAVTITATSGYATVPENCKALVLAYATALFHGLELSSVEPMARGLLW